jgi:hypothetical protein
VPVPSAWKADTTTRMLFDVKDRFEQIKEPIIFDSNVETGRNQRSLARP